jgi:hypothetical protein
MKTKPVPYAVIFPTEVNQYLHLYRDGDVKKHIFIDVDWTDELRKPDLHQCTSKLRGCNAISPIIGECCLGVLSRLQGRLTVHPFHKTEWVDYDKSRGEAETTEQYLNEDNPLSHQFEKSCVFPGTVITYSGITCDWTTHSECSGASLNDKGFTFRDIADALDFFFEFEKISKEQLSEAYPVNNRNCGSY